MRFIQWPVITLLAALPLLAGAVPAEVPPDSGDGLVQVKARRMDAAYLLPGADFRPYTKVMLDPTEVAFRKNWLKDFNDSTRGTLRRIDPDDAARIAAAARSGVGDIFQDAFQKAGYQVVAAPGADVLRISIAVVDLYVNAPDTRTPGTTTYSISAGEAKLILEARDSLSNALLGRVVDRRETQRTTTTYPQLTSSVTNLVNFEWLFKKWAQICVKGMEELKADSPVPASLKADQKAWRARRCRQQRGGRPPRTGSDRLAVLPAGGSSPRRPGCSGARGPTDGRPRRRAPVVAAIAGAPDLPVNRRCLLAK